jgi:lysophospholipase
MRAMPIPPAPNRAIPAGAVVSTWAAPDGWPLRRIDWSGDGTRGRLLFQTGRGDVFEKYLEYLAHLHAQGWSVTAFDWRGQGGSGRLSADPHVGHVTDFALYVADLAAFWRDWSMEEAGPRVAIGHSMGGHLVHRALVEGAIDPQAVVLVAPMLGLKSPLGARAGGWLARRIAGIGNPARAAWKANERPGSRLSRQALLTHDAARYADEMHWYDVDPTLRLGPPSWRWLGEAFASTAQVAADARLERVAAPVLMLLADRDALVDPAAAARIAARMRDARVVRFGAESAHEILREADPVRDRAIAAIDSFLDARVPA